MSSLTAALAAQKPKLRGGICGVCQLLHTLDDIDRQALLNALEDQSMYATDIAAVLQAEGYKIRSATVQYHRRKDCRGTE